MDEIGARKTASPKSSTRKGHSTLEQNIKNRGAKPKFLTIVINVLFQRYTVIIYANNYNGHFFPSISLYPSTTVIVVQPQ